MNPLRRLYLWLVVPPDPFRFDPRLDSVVEGLCSNLSEGQWVLNLGSGRTSYGKRVLNFDLTPFAGVEVCGDAHELPFKSRTFSGVLLRGVLEHVRSAEELRDEVRRILSPKGFLYVEVPFLQPYHLSPEDYRRFTLTGLKSFLSDFEEVRSGIQLGPCVTLAWVLRETLASLFAFGSPWMYRKMLTLSGWATFWIRYLDKMVVHAPHVTHAASAVYFLGRKSEQELSPPRVREMSPQVAAAQ